MPTFVASLLLALIAAGTAVHAGSRSVDVGHQATWIRDELARSRMLAADARQAALDGGADGDWTIEGETRAMHPDGR